MSIPIGWVIAIAALCFTLGITITLTAATLLNTPPMPGHPGDTNPHDEP